MSTEPAPLIFGIYPGSANGEGFGLLPGPYDDPTQINAALDRLQPDGPFFVRGYLQYVGGGQIQAETPANPAQYLQNGRQLEVVLAYRSPEKDIQGWVECVRGIVRRYGENLSKLQVTEEPNNPDAVYGGDGSFPGLFEALLEGVLAARDEADKLGLTGLKIGFNATPSFADDPFWPQIGALANENPGFLAALGYLGFDFFPDVFRPLPSGPDGKQMSLEDAVYLVLKGFRETSHKAGNIPPSLPIHITENGWPTNSARSPEKQAETLERIVRTVYRYRQELNVTHYEYFDLRDANSADTENLQFGLLRDDYSPKPAFKVYRRLIAELGSKTNFGVGLSLG
jgi:hypothetical protein